MSHHHWHGGARQAASTEYVQHIEALNKTIQANARELEAVRDLQLEGLKKMLQVGSLVAASVAEGQKQLIAARAAQYNAQDEVRAAAAARDTAQQARAAQQEEGQRLQREVWAAENTIDVAERLAAFIASPQAPGTDRFALALRFENGAPARISRDAAGKLFYGAFRLPGEEMKQFLEFLVAGPEPALAQQLTDAGGAKAAETGADAFRRAWKSVSEIAVFQALQSEWIDQSAYRPMIKRLNESARKRGFAGFAVETRSVALQAVLWSVALEFGPNTAVVATAWAGIDPGAVADGMLICRVFAARRKSDKNEAEPEVTRNLLKARYQLEEREALRMLAAEAGSEPQRECPK